MRSRVFALLVLTFLSAGSALAVGPWQPPFGGGGCVDCVRDPQTGDISCVPTDSPSDQHWSGCEGGYVCDYMPGGGYQCIPNCGQRCYYV
jgi:hypothetical protein